MNVRPIRITGDPVLHSATNQVTDFGPALHELVTDMVDTMREAPGVGLAAPQIGVGLAVFVWEWTTEDGVHHEGVVVNPHLTLGPIPRGRPDPEEDLEGCLSVPDLRYPLNRAETAVLTGVTALQEPLKIRASGWLARIFQHEMDHLNGKLYVDRLRWRDKRDAKKHIRHEGWGSPGLSWLPGVDAFEESGEETEEA